MFVIYRHLEQAKRARKRVTEAGSPIAIDSPDSADEISDDDPPHLVKTTKMTVSFTQIAFERTNFNNFSYSCFFSFHQTP